MSFEYVIDSCAWIEYFRGTERGKKALQCIEGDSAATSVLTLAELREKYLKESWPTFENDAAFVATKTRLTSIDREVSMLAGELNYERKKVAKGWGMEDSIILATARVASAKVVTGDGHFKGLADVVLI